MGSFLLLFYYQGKRYFAPMELGFSGSLYPWYCNQGNQCFAPSELSHTRPHCGDILGTLGVYSMRAVTNYYNKPHSGDTFATPSESSVKIQANNLATSWRNIMN